MAVAHQIERLNLGKLSETVDLPDLIEIQTKSYRDFLQWEVPPDERQMIGLQSVFHEVFPIESNNGMARLEFVSYSLFPPKNTIQECQDRGLTYAATLRAILRLVQFEEVPSSSEKVVRNIVENEVFLGELPVMTPNGTFIINGAERVIVSQLHKSPGVSFEYRQLSTNKKVLSGKITPYRGAWLEFDYDMNDHLWVTVDRRGKIPATTFLKALGYVDPHEILGLFYPIDTLTLTVRGRKRSMRLIRASSGKAGAGGRGKGKTDASSSEGEAIGLEDVLGGWIAEDVIDEDTGEIYVDAATEVTHDVLDLLFQKKVPSVKFITPRHALQDPSIVRTLHHDQIMDEDQARQELYRRLRPGDPDTTPSTYRSHFDRLFFDQTRYDLAPVGRYKINRKLGLKIDQSTRVLTKEDVVATLQYMHRLRAGDGVVDDIDHLGNRRVRAVGELLGNQIRVGLARMERTIRERLGYSQQDPAQMTPQGIVNPKPLQAAIKEFFGRSPLSHFMDQINPLAELTHKRRLSALGPGGLSRDRAGFEVRDVHPTHYGRICPIETPEGPNIGLMASLATYARINEFGFIETPYRKVEKGRVTGEVHMLSAYDEDNYTVAQANAELDGKGRFVSPLVLCRRRGDFPRVAPEQVDYMDVSTRQMVSVASALVPFLEHDDANRALMGSNMQRQAVPLLRTEAPLVGTGLEAVAARNSGAVVIAERDGVVEYADGNRILVRVEEREAEEGRNPFRAEVDEYVLRKYQRSNQNTCINQRPLVMAGDRVKKGAVIADGTATDRGELALGRNVLVAFMPWEGYNFEDAIILNEDLVKEDVFTSVHISVHEIEARETKLGPEEVTRDIPNVGEDALRNLDERGIVYIGAKVGPDDILVGKVTPKGETDLTPEEKLLRAIFGDKAEDVRDASLRMPTGASGVVIDVKICSRRDKSQDAQAKKQFKQEQERLEQYYEGRIVRIRETFERLVREDVMGLTILEDVVDYATDEVVLEKGRRVMAKHIRTLPYSVLARLKVSDPAVQQKFSRLVNMAALEEATLIAQRDARIERLRKGDELPAGVLKSVKVYVASRRRMSVGDKMGGRHGNKGVVSKIVPREDMPFLPDGTPVQILLNSLGVPSRMNVGQLLETHLGWAVQKLGLRVASPVFNGASEEKIRELLRKAGLPENGKLRLRDGKTGEPMYQDTCVGYIYMMKLNHLVDDKIHARATGPYSLVTQQPLGGKAQNGGQRFGEMEVWALEAYGAAYTLQEMLTIKSDDLQGRTWAYEAIVKGTREVDPGTPESFNVLVREMQALCLDVIKLVRKRGIGAEMDEEEEE
ncbi:MAG: DNA-directed RNA polymerase subunit beta [Candidatus Hydrogenedentes bacterium]|nr:DNA-directed RNA polymerase subunit beta [Candidatus Hydrogenedentota bacterium]